MRGSRLAVLIALGGLACGPSFQAVYECDVRFEHCYALDESGAAAAARKECWRGWLHGFTYGQSRDRVEYAEARFSQLSLGPMLPSEEARAPRPPPNETAVVAPVPTNAFASPPHLSPSVSASASSSPPEAINRAPGADCSDACTHRWTACRDECKGPGCDECDRSYRVCVPACFRDEAPSHKPTRSLE